MKTKITTALCALALIGMIPAVAATKSKSTASKPATKSVMAEKPSPKVSETEKKLVSDLTTTQKSKLLTLLNEGEPKELVAIPGVAKVRADYIVKARPFKSVEEITLVSGIGKATFAKVISHGKTLTRRTTTKKS